MVVLSQEIHMEAVIENSDMVVDFIMEMLDSITCSMSIKNQIITAVEELFGNVAKYANVGKIGTVTINCTIKVKTPIAIIKLSDMGIPFNPLEYHDPNTNVGLRERKIGGLGIFIAKRSVDQLLYEYTKGQNIVTLIKKIASRLGRCKSNV